jgi:hypothetical protein
MISKLKLFIVPAIAVLAIATAVFVDPAAVAAQSAIDEACQSSPNSPICRDDTDVNDIIMIVVNTLLFVIGIISVIMIIIGGIMYTTSAGDSGQVTKAKNTILYAVIGLVVALLAFAIVNWVVDQFV